MGDRETARVEAFSDAVFAIAITLLILEIKVPHLAGGVSNHALLAALGARWPSYVAFAMSFASILIMWVNHHGVFGLVRQVNPQLLFANGFLLLMVTFVPFPTAVLAEYLDKGGLNTAAAFYCGTYVLISVGYNWLWRTAATGGRLIGEHVSTGHATRIRRAYQLGLGVYLAATLLSWWNGALGLLLSSLLWVLWARLSYRPEAPGPSE